MSRTDPRTIELFTHSLAIRDTPAVLLRTPRADRTVGALSIEGSTEGRVIRRKLPPVFAPGMRFTPWGKGRVAVARDTEYRIVLTGSGGTHEIRRALAPRAVSERDREAVRQAGLDRWERQRAMSVNGFRAIAPNLAALEFAPRVPVIAGLAADRAGRLWVARTGSVAPGPGPIDILSPDGRYLGTISAMQLPSAFGPNDRIARIVVDELGVERVVVERVTGIP